MKSLTFGKKKLYTVIGFDGLNQNETENPDLLGRHDVNGVSISFQRSSIIDSIHNPKLKIFCSR